MSLHPSYISPKLDFSEQSLPPMPGKRYGIYSVLCGLMPILATAFELWTESLGTPHLQANDILTGTSLALSLSIPLFVIAGIIFGIHGLDTEGRRYAIAGLVLNALPILVVLALPIAFAWLVVFMMFGLIT